MSGIIGEDQIAPMLAVPMLCAAVEDGFAHDQNNAVRHSCGTTGQCGTGYIADKAKTFSFLRMCAKNGIDVNDPVCAECRAVYNDFKHRVEEAIDERDRNLNALRAGDLFCTGFCQEEL